MNEVITVFTPSYNRKHTLHRCYESLLKQSNKSFIWMIIDDGSTDGTEELVRQWQMRDNGFEIQYVYKENGGLHTGYNKAIELCTTELMMCIDSDDYVAEEAIQTIILFWNAHGSDEYAGIVAPDKYENGEIIGDPLPDQKSVNLIDLMCGKYKINNGDRENVVRTELYKSVAPMKSFGEEKNFNPHYMHLQISKKYDFLVLNEPLRVVQYQENGMTANIFRQYLNSPKSFAQSRRLYMTFENTPLKFRIKTAIHYVSSCIIGKDMKSLFKINNKPLVFLSIPFGFLLSIYIRYKGK